MSRTKVEIVGYQTHLVHTEIQRRYKTDDNGEIIDRDKYIECEIVKQDEIILRRKP